MSNEWYTPSKYIEAARQVMGSIDLDPASCELANQTVRATAYYTKEQDGLALPWYGNVWLNPPFMGTVLRKRWTQKLLREYEKENINQAILLMPFAPDTGWFQPLWQFLICSPTGRIYYHQEKVHRENPNFASCFTYLGTNEQKFIDVFSQFGTIARAVRTGVLV